MRFKLSKTWIVIIVIILLVAGYFGLKQLLKNPLDIYIIESVEKGDVLQEISETGNVQATDNISLSFKTVGRIQNINVRIGDEVKRGQILGSIDASQTSSQLKNYQAALNIAKSQYDKLINGYTPEDIKTYEGARDSAEHDLDSEYASAINILEDAYTKIYNSLTTVNGIQSSYFSLVDQQGIKVIDRKAEIRESTDNVKKYFDIARASSNSGDVDNAINQAIISLNNVSSALKVIRDICDEGIYNYKVSSTDKTSLDTQKGYINTALTNVTTSQQDIKFYKIALQKAEDNLFLRQAEPRQEDIDVYKAQIEQAEANVSLYQSQLNEAYLISPIDGKVTDINYKIGEVASINQPVINLLSSNPFQIKADIYEQDIVNVKVNDSVWVTLIAFSKNPIMGKVVLIDPAEKIVDQVVYYEVTIDFPNELEGIRSGMTADIVIQANKRENVLRVQKNVVTNIDGREIIQIVGSGKIEDREIVTGLEGNDYYEVISGLNEKDKIITGKK
ncbi:MAG: efflux RND transporter periplasmic adaptor subunit [bacterium]